MTPYYEANGITIYHGDCRDVLPTLPDAVADAALTDPPYKLSQEYGPNTDPDNLVAVASLATTAPALLRAVRPGAVCALFYDARILPLAMDAMGRAGWKYLRSLTFYRRWGNAALVHGWMSTSDFILVYCRPGDRAKFHAQPRHDVYLRDRAEIDNTGHPAQKPLDAVRHLLSNITPADGLVLDPYAGSGTTLMAAHLIGLRAIGIEAEERYCEIAARRLSQGVLPLEGAAD